MSQLHALLTDAAHTAATGRNTTPEPTHAQKLAGNYRMGRFRLHGMDLAIENPEGTFREGTDTDGQPWRTRLAAHYGYFAGTRGADGDPVDVFIGVVPESPHVWVVNQVNPDGSFDEHKIMLGFGTEDLARAGYLGSYSPGWQGLGSMVRITLAQLRWWLKSGDRTAPIRAAADLLSAPETRKESNMKPVQWDNTAQPVGQTIGRVLYDIRLDDVGDDLLTDPMTMDEALSDPDIECLLVLDALVVEAGMLKPKTDQILTVLKAAGKAVQPQQVEIGEPVRLKGTMQIPVIYGMSDGQTLTIWFHNPDTTPAKLAPMDVLVSARWVINKKDVTIAVAPEKGKDLSPRDVARRIMALIEKNSAAFLRVNAKAGERAAQIEGLQGEIAGLEQTLDGLKVQIERAQEVKASAAAKKLNAPTGRMVDLGNNESYFVGVSPNADGTFTAMTASTSKTFKTLAGANRWMENRAQPAPAGAQTAEPDPAPAVPAVPADQPAAELPAAPEPAPEPVPDWKSMKVPDLMTAEQYAMVYGVPEAEAYWQDVLDHQFGQRLVDTRNAVRALGWDAEKFQWPMANAEGVKLDADFRKAGAGDIVGVTYQVSVGGEGVAAVRDDLSMSPAELAAEINARAPVKAAAPVDPFGGPRKKFQVASKWEYAIKQATPDAYFHTDQSSGETKAYLEGKLLGVLGSDKKSMSNRAISYEKQSGYIYDTPVDDPAGAAAAGPRAMEPGFMALNVESTLTLIEAAGVSASTVNALRKNSAGNEMGVKLNLKRIAHEKGVAPVYGEQGTAPGAAAAPEPAPTSAAQPPESQIPPVIKARVEMLIDRLRAKKDVLAGVERARGNGHTLSLEWDRWKPDVMEKLGRLERLRETAKNKGLGERMNEVITAYGGVPDFSMYRTTDEVRAAEDAAPAASSAGAALAQAPITVSNRERVRDENGFPVTRLTLSDGSVHDLQKMDSIGSMGLPGWHIVSDKATGAGWAAVQPTYMGDNEAQAVESLLRRENKRAGSVATSPAAAAPVPAADPPDADLFGDAPQAFQTQPVALTPEGAESKVKTAKGTEVLTGYSVIEADRLITSHDPSTGDANPAFPPELQPRDRGRDASIAWVRKTANDLDPDLLGKSRRADSGAPIIGPDGVVESGNGRTMAVVLAYQSGKATDYRAWLEDEATYFGLKPEKVKAMRRPVLVRIRTSKVDRAAFAIEANQSDTLAMTATEKAKSDARRMDDGMIALMTENGDLAAAENVPFLSAFLRTLGEAEAAQYSTSDGKPTSTLIARVQSAIFSRAYADDRLLELLADTAKPEIANLVKALNNAAPEFIQAAAMDPDATSAATGKLTDAVEKSLNQKAVDALLGASNVIRQAKDAGQSVEEFVGQSGLFGDIDPDVAAMAVFIAKNNRSAKRMGEAFKAMASFIKGELQRRQTADMFGDGEPVDFKDIVAAANRELERMYGAGVETIGLFDRPAVVEEPRQFDHQGVDIAAMRRAQDAEVERWKAGRQRSAIAHENKLANVPLPEWVQFEGVEVLRVEGSNFIAVPANGKRTAATFDVLQVDPREFVVQLKKRDGVASWLHSKAVVEFEDKTGRLASSAPVEAAPAAEVEPDPEPDFDPVAAANREMERMYGAGVETTGLFDRPAVVEEPVMTEPTQPGGGLAGVDRESMEEALEEVRQQLVQQESEPHNLQKPAQIEFFRAKVKYFEDQLSGAAQRGSAIPPTKSPLDWDKTRQDLAAGLGDTSGVEWSRNVEMWTPDAGAATIAKSYRAPTNSEVTELKSAMKASGLKMSVSIATTPKRVAGTVSLRPMIGGNNIGTGAGHALSGDDFTKLCKILRSLGIGQSQSDWDIGRQPNGYAVHAAGLNYLFKIMDTEQPAPETISAATAESADDLKKRGYDEAVADLRKYDRLKPGSARGLAVERLAGLPLGREFGESIDAYLARNPFLSGKEAAYQDMLAGKIDTKPAAAPAVAQAAEVEPDETSSLVAREVASEAEKRGLTVSKEWNKYVAGVWYYSVKRDDKEVGRMYAPEEGWPGVYRTMGDAGEDMGALSAHAAIDSIAKASESDFDPVAAVNAAYTFDKATDDFKAMLAESLDQADYSEFATAKGIDQAVKAAGGTVSWSLVVGAILDSVAEISDGWEMDDPSEYEGVFDSVGEGEPQGVIRKGARILGRAVFGGDGKAMIYVGKAGADRVTINGQRAMWGEEPQALVSALFVMAGEVVMVEKTEPLKKYRAGELLPMIGKKQDLISRMEGDLERAGGDSSKAAGLIKAISGHKRDLKKYRARLDELSATPTSAPAETEPKGEKVTKKDAAKAADQLEFVVNDLSGKTQRELVSGAAIHRRRIGDAVANVEALKAGWPADMTYPQSTLFAAAQRLESIAAAEAKGDDLTIGAGDVKTMAMHAGVPESKWPDILANPKSARTSGGIVTPSFRMGDVKAAISRAMAPAVPAPAAQDPDVEFLRSVIDKTAPDMLDPALADKIEAVMTRRAGDAQIDDLAGKAIDAYMAVAMEATAGLK